MGLSRIRARGARLLVAAAAVIGVAASLPGAAAAHWRGGGGGALYVSSGGSDGNDCTFRAPCASIGRAVDQSSPGQIIFVGRGTYREMVTVTTRVRLIGIGRPVIDATGQVNGILLNGPGAAGSSVQGFTVQNADQEGILAQDTSRLSLRGNVVENNDLGATSANPTGECAPQGQVPGDCGEGLHLMSVTRSIVSGNTATGNQGGILLTDELGPTSGNLIFANHVFRNDFDCGITVAGHNPNAVGSDGSPQADQGGIYDNRIVGNVSDDNGLKGEGAGIILAGAGPGTGVYDNLVFGNEASGNNLAGIALHSHAPGDDLNGNRIVGNRVSNDNLGGDPDANVPQTTGILLFSAVTQLKGTVVVGNVIRNVHFGIWTQNVPAIPPFLNVFIGVDVPVSQH